MSFRWWALGGFTVATSLACAGGGTPAEPVDGAAEPAPTDGEEPAPPADDGSITVAFLTEAVGGNCSFGAKTYPSGEGWEIAQLEGPCPDQWSLAVASTGDRAVVYAPDRAWGIGPSGAKRLPTPPDPIEAFGFDGETVVVCGPAHDAVHVDTTDENKLRWTLDGVTYDAELGGEVVDASVDRSHRLDQGAWVVRSAAVIEMIEGSRPPWCDGLPDWPKDGAAIVATDQQPDSTGWSDVPEAELAPLTAIDPGTWSKAPSGTFAARTEWLEGLMFGMPVVRLAAGGAPTVIPELPLGASGVSYDIRGSWLLINTETGGLLRDGATGDRVWTTSGAAVLWPVGIAVLPAATGNPPPASDGGGDDDGPAPVPRDPAKAKAKAKAKAGTGDHPKAKGKAKQHP